MILTVETYRLEISGLCWSYLLFSFELRLLDESVGGSLHHHHDTCLNIALDFDCSESREPRYKRSLYSTPSFLRVQLLLPTFIQRSFCNLIILTFITCADSLFLLFATYHHTIL